MCYESSCFCVVLCGKVRAVLSPAPVVEWKEVLVLYSEVYGYMGCTERQKPVVRHVTELYIYGRCREERAVLSCSYLSRRCHSGLLPRIF